MSAREAALRALVDVERGRGARESLDDVLGRSALSGADRSLATELVYGVTRRRLTLDDELARLLSGRRPADLTPWVRNAIRLGLYQLRHLRVPAYAAVNDAVEQCRRHGHAGVAALCNAVLRRAQREPAPEPPSLAVATSHPEWLVTRWTERLGSEEARALLEADNAAPPLVVRTNRLRTNPADLARSLGSAGAETRPGRWCPEALVVAGGPAVPQYRAFRRGWFTVQDESSMLASRVLDPQPGETVLDLAAAPGGKATHLAELMGDAGRVMANDLPDRLPLLREAVHRLGLRSVQPLAGDARDLPEQLEGTCHRVMADVPCSGLGTLARRPELRWRKGPGEIGGAVALQREMLAAAAACLAPGGALVYSTCTTEPEENDEVVDAFLAAAPDFEPSDLRPYLPEGLRGERGAERGRLHLWPHRHGTDGFFIARLQRRGGGGAGAPRGAAGLGAGAGSGAEGRPGPVGSEPGRGGLAGAGGATARGAAGGGAAGAAGAGGAAAAGAAGAAGAGGAAAAGAAGAAGAGGAGGPGVGQQDSSAGRGTQKSAKPPAFAAHGEEEA